MTHHKSPKQIIQDLIDTPEFQTHYHAEKRRLEFAVKLKRIIEALHISQEELAQRMRVKPSYISRIVNGKTDITVSTLQKMCDSLGVGIEFTLQ